MGHRTTTACTKVSKYATRYSMSSHSRKTLSRVMVLRSRGPRSFPPPKNVDQSVWPHGFLVGPSNDIFYKATSRSPRHRVDLEALGGGGGGVLKRMPWDDVTRRQSFMLKADAGIGISWGKWMSSLPRLADHRARSRQVCDQVWQALKDRRQELLDANCELIVNLMSHWHTSSKLLFGTSLLEYHTGFRYIENTGVNTSIR